MQAPSQPLTQFPSMVALDQSAILMPPNLAPDDIDWILNTSLTFKVLAGAGKLDHMGIAKAIANIALLIMELVQDNKKACDEVKDTVNHLKDLKHDLSKMYGKTGFWAKTKRPFQGKAILDDINQHKGYINDARDKLIVEEVAAKVTDIHDHLVNVIIIIISIIIVLTIVH
ncbi:hypothetical protein EDD18DRAFT_1098018 [Armillaria luteobubalina]|uniref:Uncharacterized protein n=1 Tax=Armillaria luteobubalina TaxID=153913 RepID=A0AA39V5Q5_9AGAR|nr:hypothetical protein EDD18DRAFT_1098018 [Armillaria luteobubalina]